MNLDIVYTLFVVAKIRASLLQMIIWRDRMMELGILVIVYKLPFSCIKSVSKAHKFIIKGLNTQPKKNHEKMVVFFLRKNW